MENDKDKIISQGLLFTTKEDEEYFQLEKEIAAAHPKFAGFPEEKRRFVVAYLTRAPKDSMADVARKAGIGKTKAYDLARDPEICDVFAAAAMTVSTMTDVKASLAIDMAVEMIYDATRKGDLKPKDWTPVMLRMCEAGKSRLGLMPQTVSATKSSVELPDGTRVQSQTFSAVASSDDVSKLLAASERTRLQLVEAVSAEIVQAQEINCTSIPPSVQTNERLPEQIAPESAPNASPAS